MSATRDRAIRTSFIVSGSLLVIAFLTWIMLRAQGALGPGFGMETAAGWIAQAAAVLVLFAGLALLARGIFARAQNENSRPTEKSE